MNSWNPFSYPPKAVLKSVWGFFLPGLAMLLNDFTDPNKHVVTGRDYIVAALTALVSGYGVFRVSNAYVTKPTDPVTPVNGPVYTPEGGFVGVLAIIGVALILIAILGLVGVLSLSLALCVIFAIIGVLLVVVDARSGTLR